MSGDDSAGPGTPRDGAAGRAPGAPDWADVAAFRKADRARLYALRRELPQAEQARQAARVAATLDRLLTDLNGVTVAGYWPIRAELDLRPWLARAAGQGARLALPVVIARDRPVAFHEWAPGARMTRGIWNIPVPAAPRAVTPDIVIAPLLGVDDGCYRLGNGGGYYDRTLAALARPCRIIGVGHDFCPVQTIFPQAWDVPMDEVVLGDGSHVRRMAPDP